MARRLKIGDRVSWNSEAGRVSGRIVKVHTRDVNYKGYVHHASKEAPQYEIKSDKTDHIALHKATALRLKPRKRPPPGRRSRSSRSATPRGRSRSSSSS